MRAEFRRWTPASSAPQQARDASTLRPHARQTDRLLFTIHGIRTLGAWQDALNPVLKERGWTHCAFKYGYFSLPRFLNKWSRKKIAEDFHEWYLRRRSKFEPDDRIRRVKRPSIIAHSFGSLVVGETMAKYKEIKFDKIILCGSILPNDFNWRELLSRNQVWGIRNEFGFRDKWSKLAVKIIPETGDSGYRGFDMDSPCITQELFKYHEHSDYFRLGHSQEH